MKEKLYTIELHDALTSGDECPFCWLERKLEEAAIEFVLGSSYMESDIRDQTDKRGFCRRHTKAMFDYGNTLGNAWILKTRMVYLRERLKKEMGEFSPQPASVLSRIKRKEGQETSVSAWIRREESHCYVCDRVNETYERVLDTFVHQVKHEKEFLDLVKAGKGFCIHHFADLVEVCEKKLGKKEQDLVFPRLFEQMNRELDRIQEDIDWLIEKYDYTNADKSWKNSQDAVQRTMQKIVGGHPADPVFRSRK
ncbi:MAG: hypothetical protein HFG75_05500 [Hungatella sp.]|nr:hypothetical protein [Hungatella sp.]